MYRFGDFVLDIQDHTLTLSDRPIHLRPKSFDTLVYLLRRPGKLVTKDELLGAVWSDVVVTDGVLTHCIEEIRSVLGDDARHAQFLQTVPHRGYRFIARVWEEEAACEDAIVEEEITTVSVRVQSQEGCAIRPDGNPESIPSPRWKRGRVIPVALAGASLLIACVVLVQWLAGGEQQPPRAITSLAVLPFQDLNQDPNEEYFADGLTDAMIAELARIRTLRVISRTSAMQYKNSPKPLAVIAGELHVDGIIEGSVFRSGGRVRITAALISAGSERHIWSETYDMDQRDVVGRLRHIARTLARELPIVLPPEEQGWFAGDRTMDPAVYELTLKGRYHWNKRTAEGFRKGIECFEQALVRDPVCASAYVGLADCYNMLGDYDLLPPASAFPKARASALQALSIDRLSAEAHASLAFAAMRFDWDWSEVEKEYRLATEMNPSSSNAHHWYGLYLAMRGRFDEAREELDRAHALDPLALIITANRAWVRYYARDYDAALGLCREALELDSGFVSAHIKLGWVYEQMDRLPEACAQFQGALDTNPHDPAFQLFLAHTSALQGKGREALGLIDAATGELQKEYLPSYHVAAAYAGLGDRGRSFNWLWNAFRERSGWLPWLKVDPKFDALRGEPEFGILLDSLRLKE